MRGRLHLERVFSFVREIFCYEKHSPRCGSTFFSNENWKPRVGLVGQHLLFKQSLRITEKENVSTLPALGFKYKDSRIYLFVCVSSVLSH